jgi:hypothetical protein
LILPLLSDRILGVLRVGASCAAAIACGGLIMLHPGVMMVGIIIAVLCAYLLVMQASLRRATLLRADSGTCKRCGYQHNLTPSAAGSSPTKCPECGAATA